MKKLSALVAFIALTLSNLAVAGPVYNGTYGLANAGSPSWNRGIWTNAGDFSTVSGSFAVSGSTAVLSGNVFRSAINGGFLFNVGMDYMCSSTVSNAGGNNVSVDNAACGLGNQPTGGAVSGAEADGNTWDFWDWNPSVLVGYGSLDGLTVGISIKPTNSSGDPTKPFRVGIAADWDDDNLLGASGWMNIDSKTCLAGANCNAQSSFINSLGNADFNFQFTSVPEPAPLALLGLGLLGLGATRRRRSA